jgi:Concanavalin A-like lectin/glucanases superfamily
MLSLPNTWSWVGVQSGPQLSPTGGFTVEAWCKFDPAATGGSNKPTIVRNAAAFSLRRDCGCGGLIEFVVRTSGIFELESPGAMIIPVLSWQHFAGTWDGTTMRIFLNGVQIASMPTFGTLDQTPGTLSMGGDGDPNDTWHGTIDEVRIWNSARTASQIQSTMNKRLDFTPGLLAAWHFDGSFQDPTGGFDGTPIAGAALINSTSPVLMHHLTVPAAAPIGQTLGFEVFVGVPLSSYFLELSLTGSVPGIALPSPLTGTFPLNPPLVYQALGAVAPSAFTGFVGNTGSNALAYPQLHLPADPIFIGYQISAAFAVLSPFAPPPLNYAGASNATMTVVTP